MLKRTTYIMLFWAIEALNQDVEKKTSDQTDEKPAVIDFAVGGQAVVEGVMMRSPNNISIAVRKPDESITIKRKPYKTLTQRYTWLNVPIARGVINLIEMMIIGTEAINFSANEALDEISAEGNSDNLQSKSIKKSHDTVLKKLIEISMFVISLILALAFSVFLFKFIPLWLTTFVETKSTYISENYILFNLIDGVIKMLIFLSYIYILSLFTSFNRVFQYHGAEHKSIYNYESGEPLSVENAAQQTRFHPRCGTSFILIVFAVSIIIYTFVPRAEEFWANLALRLALLPLIAGISYEYLKLSAKHANNPFVKALIQPGLWFQRLTTKEPDSKQLEVGLKSLKTALEMEKVIS